jgi:hypothetical protein
MQPRRPQARAMQHEQKRAFYLHQPPRRKKQKNVVSRETISDGIG